MSTTAVQSDAKKYELMVIINPDIGELAIKKRLETIRSQIIAFPAEVFHEEIWGLRDLAYPIKKHEQGCYALFDFETDPSKIKEIDGNLRLEPEVLRYLVMVLPSSYTPKDYTIEEIAVETPGDDKKAAVRPLPEKPEKKATEAPKKELVKTESTEKSSKVALENVDAKLQSILENPDLNF